VHRGPSGVLLFVITVAVVAGESTPAREGMVDAVQRDQVLKSSAVLAENTNDTRSKFERRCVAFVKLLPFAGFSCGKVARHRRVRVKVISVFRDG
jgi:hypothetical protein